MLALLLVVVPFWTSFLIRTYALKIILDPHGYLARDLGIDILYTKYAVGVGLVYNYLPLFILPVFASLERMDWTLIEAATDLGARPFTAFRADHAPAHPARRRDRGAAGVHPDDRRVHHPQHPGRREVRVRRQRDRRPVQPGPEPAVRLGAGDRADGGAVGVRRRRTSCSRPRRSSSVRKRRLRAEARVHGVGGARLRVPLPADPGDGGLRLQQAVARRPGRLPRVQRLRHPARPDRATSRSGTASPPAGSARACTTHLHPGDRDQPADRRGGRGHLHRARPVRGAGPGPDEAAAARAVRRAGLPHPRRAGDRHRGGLAHLLRAGPQLHPGFPSLGKATILFGQVVFNASWRC